MELQLRSFGHPAFFVFFAYFVVGMGLVTLGKSDPLLAFWLSQRFA